MRLAVVGGTGLVGSLVVEAARARGHEVVSISRRTGVDVIAGDGLEEALDGAEVVIDCLNVNSLRRGPATKAFVSAAANVSQALEGSGGQRVVVLSIVGIDRAAGYGYYDAKRAQEAAYAEGAVPSSVVRAAQFFEFGAQILERSRRGPIAVVPAMRIQPLAAATVADQLLAAAESEVTESMEVAGPEPMELVDLVRATVPVESRAPRLLTVPIPGAAGRAIRSGALLAPPDAQLLGPTLATWRAARDRSTSG